MKISIILPVFKATNVLDELVRRIIQSVESIISIYEIILMDDACLENHWEKLKLWQKLILILKELS
jgi:dolichol-phosphate mannosyltransferase